MYPHVILKPRPSSFIAWFAHTQLHSARALAITDCVNGEGRGPRLENTFAVANANALRMLIVRGLCIPSVHPHVMYKPRPSPFFCRDSPRTLRVCAYNRGPRKRGKAWVRSSLVPTSSTHRGKERLVISWC